MKIARNTNPISYCVSYSDNKTVTRHHKSFKTIEEAADFACIQGEYIESCHKDVVDFVKKNNHKMKYKGGFQEFCV